MYCFTPKGVCSKEMHITLREGIIVSVEVIAGCPGNLQGICKLIKGRKASEVISLLKGTRCGARETSCPDQLAIGLEKALAKQSHTRIAHCTANSR